MNEINQEEELLKVEIYSLAYIYYCIDEKNKIINKSQELLNEIKKEKSSCSYKLSMVRTCYQMNIDSQEEAIYKNREKKLTNRLIIYDKYLDRLNLNINYFKNEIIQNQNELNRLINNVVAIKGKDLILNKNNVYGYYEIMHNGLASNWKELVATYETRLYRGEVIHYLGEVVNSLNRIESQLEGINNILVSINSSISNIAASINSIKNDLGDIKINLSQHLNKIETEVKNIRPYFIPKQENNIESSNKNDFDHSMCLLCVKNNNCLQKKCTGFYPR